LVANGTSIEVRWQRWVLAAGLAADLELDEFVTVAKAADQPELRVRFSRV